MKRQQHRKNCQSGTRSAGGQTTLQSFLFKPRASDGEVNPPPPPAEGATEAPIRPPPKREMVRVTRATIKEKPSAFSSVGSAGKDRGGGEAGGAVSAAVFKRFHHSSAPVARADEGGRPPEAGDGGDLDFGRDVRLDVEETGAQPGSKRRSPLGGDEHGSDAKARRVVVLGDDPRPRPMSRRGRARPTRGGGGQGKGGHALYNHYASGGGWWHGDMEGVDGEEVGWTDDMWEGMGSVTLGGLEWH